MNRIEVERLTGELLAGRLSQAEFRAELGDVTLDLDRQRRCGFPEVVFGQSKSVETLSRIFRRLLDEEQPVLATRIDEDKARLLMSEFPGGRYNAAARTFRIDRRTSVPACSEPGASEDACSAGLVSIVTAGTSDMAVAEEV